MLTDIREAVDEVMELKKFGGNSIVDVTNSGFGRDSMALKDISLETGVNINMGSGYYIAAGPAAGHARKGRGRERVRGTDPISISSRICFQQRSGGKGKAPKQRLNLELAETEGQLV